MGIFDKFKKGKRVLVIGLDGTPFTFVKKLTEAGELPNLKRILGTGTCRQMRSILPTVSCVAWSCFSTGKNPGKHNIFGFIDKNPGTYSTILPNASNMMTTTLWEYLSLKGKASVVISVPVTYPPRRINGILVSCFLTPNIEKGTYPKHIAAQLKEMGYIIDVDPWKARQDLDSFYPAIMQCLEKRIEAMTALSKQVDWDFMITHFMSTDRIHHFMWEYWETKHEKYYDQFMSFYRRIDKFLGNLFDNLDKNTTLIIMSDHGFCSIKQEVYINHWLKENGYLKMISQDDPELKSKKTLMLSDIIPEETKAFSMDPGRIFINLKNREPKGSVENGSEYEELKARLKKELSLLKNPATGEVMIDRVVDREEIYSGPYFNSAADLIMSPLDGYDLKGNFSTRSLTGRTPLVGMHTYHDAMLFIQEHEIIKTDLEILDVYPTILKIMKLPEPEGLDGKACI